jgi:peptidoglycan/xylan/chitin deacetylase (PgdA/CDA1 family)
VPYAHAKATRILLKRRAKARRALVLTFDDGPGSRLTPAILNMLAEHDAKATFFLLGRNIAGREEIVRQISQQGHEICSHGYDHLHYWRISPIRAIKDIQRGWRAIDCALGTVRQTYPFRPPKGRLNIVSMLYLLAYRVPIVYWSLDFADTSPSDSRDKNRIVSLVEGGGAVTLAHDFDRINRETERFILESLELVLETAKRTDLRLLTISELLAK